MGDLDRDGDLDVTVGTVWFENPRLPGGKPATVPWRAHRIGSAGGNQDVAIGDLDRDGKPDVVLRGEAGSVVTLSSRRDLHPGLGATWLRGSVRKGWRWPTSTGTGFSTLSWGGGG